MKFRTIFLCFLVLFSLLVSVPSSAQTATSDYEVEGDHVWVDNVNIRLEVWPHTSSGGWVYCNLTTKLFTGTIDLVFGFDSLHRPSKFELYQPYTVQHNHNESIPLEYVGYEFPSEPVANRTYFYFADSYSSPSLAWSKLPSRSRLFVAGILYFYKWNNLNRMWDLQRTQAFDYLDNRVGRWLFIWHTSELVEWLKWTKGDFQIQKFSYGEMKTWYVIPLNVNASKSLYCRFWLDVLPSTEKENLGKYWVAVKRHSESFFDAVRFRHFYALDPWWDATFPYKVKLTIDATKIDADLVDFPVAVFFDSGNMNWSNVQDDLDDFRFVDSTESTLLDAELESYTTNTDAVIHVRIPSVDDTTDTDFYCYFGNPTAAPAWNPSGVWDSNFVMVQHMTDSPDTSHIADSTSNNNDMTKSGVAHPTQTANGKIDSAQDFILNTDAIQIQNSASLNLNGKPLTIEAWVKFDSFPHNYGFIIDKSINQTGQLLAWGFDHNTKADLKLRAIIYDGDYNQIVTGTTVLQVATWYHLAATYTGNTLRVYVDGAEEGVPYTTGGAIVDLNTNYLTFAPIDFYLDANVDQVCISDIARPLAWIKAEYWSGLDGLLTYGSSQQIQPLTIGEFQAPAIVYPSKSTWLNVTASYDLGNTSIKNVTLTLPEGIELLWNETSKAFSEVADPNNFFTLSANSTYVNVNSTSYKVCFKGTFASTYPEGYKTGIGEVYTDDGLSASHTETDWFLFSTPPSDFAWILAFVIALVALSLILLYKER